jgi:hypothetical protein
MRISSIYWYAKLMAAALGLLACLLLIASWLRSHYGYSSVVLGNFVDSRVLVMQSFPGSIAIDCFEEPVQDPKFYWIFESQPEVYNLDTYPLIFRLRDESINSSVIRYWFLVVLSMGLASVPWVRWRFSLATMLIATAVISFLLGILVLSM